MDIKQMRDSWLEAVTNGEAEGFSRTFVPEILDELWARQVQIDRLRDALFLVHSRADSCEKWSKDGLCEISDALAFPDRLTTKSFHVSGYQGPHNQFDGNGKERVNL